MIFLPSYQEIIKKNKVEYDPSIEGDYISSCQHIYCFMKKHKLVDEFKDIFKIMSVYHKGMRKGGKIPEIQHFLSIAEDIIKLEPLIKKARLSIVEMLKIAFLHDLFEDYGMHAKESSISPFVEKEHLIEATGSKEITEKTMILSKFDEIGKKVKSKKYYKKISEYPELVLIKMLDRKDSLKTMRGVFSEEKQLSYKEQYEKYIEKMGDLYLSEDRFRDVFLTVKKSIKELI